MPGSGAADRLGGAAPASGASIVRSRLFIKYVALFVSVVVLALVANGAFEVWFSFQEQKASLINIQHQQAEAAADKIEEFVTQIQSQLGWTTQLPWTDGTLDQRRFDALRLLRQVPAITELAQIDASGHEQLQVSRLTMDVVGSGIDYSNKPEFTEAMADKVYYGPVYFRRESEPYMTISLAGARRDTGVSIAQVNLKLIWDVVSKHQGRRARPRLRGRRRRPPDRASRHQPGAAQHRHVEARPGPERRAPAAPARTCRKPTTSRGHKVLTAYAPVHPLGWFVFVETPIEEAYAPLYRVDPAHRLRAVRRAGARLHRRHVPRRPHGGADPGAARRRGAHRLRRPRPAHRHQDRRRGRGAGQPVQRHGGPSCRNPMPTWRRRSTTAPAN